MSKVEDLYLSSPLFIQQILFNIYARKITKQKFQEEFCLKFQDLEKSRNYSYSQLRLLQEKKLQLIIDHCYRNVPFYRERFDQVGLKPSDIKGLDDLHRIPILTRDQVKHNLVSLAATNMPEKQRMIRNTSGTTGSPMFFFVDKKSYAINRAYTLRYWKWAGFNVGDKRITLQGRRIVNWNRTRPPFWMYNKWDKQLLFSTYHLSEALMPYFVEKLNEFRPQIIEGYPSAVYVLAKYMDDKNLNYRSKAVFTSSETLYPIQREVIEKVFECKIFDKYGLSEMFFIATECEQHKGLHLNMEYAIVEILDEWGQAVAPGTAGRIVCTGLENYSMPLIRYDTGDIGSLLPDMCPCGRNSPLMSPVTTKAEDQILTPEGRYISGSLLTFPFKPMRNIIKSQLVQEESGLVKVKIVRNKDYSDEDSRVLVERLGQCLGPNVKIVLEFVDDIERTKSGKYRWVISNVHRKMDFKKNNV